MSKRADFSWGAKSASEKHWRSIDEFVDSAEFRETIQNEFPDGADELKDGVGRRSFIGLMGASLGLAGLQGCRRPEEKILPYSKRPEDLIPGQPQFFATAAAFGGSAVGLLVESHEGRPTKIEGNPQHPNSLGSTSYWQQATVLDLYDPTRSKTPAQKGQKKSWADAAKALQQAGAASAAKQGQGLAILTESHRSPTLQAQLARLLQVMPKAQVVRYDPLGRENVRAGARLAFGRALEGVYDLSRAKVIVSLDSDLLGNEADGLRHARAWADARRSGEVNNRLYAIESTFSASGAAADHRLRMKSGNIPGFIAALGAQLASKHGVALPEDVLGAIRGAKVSGDPAARWVVALAKDLAANRGASVLALGANHAPAVHALVNHLNVALGNVGQSVRFVRTFTEATDGADGITALTKSMASGAVDTLLVLGGNPSFDAPSDAGFGAALAKVKTSFHLSSFVDETSGTTTWHVNRAHDLESWSDVRALDGTASIVQPLIAPLYKGRTDAEAVELLLGGRRKAYALVRETWTPTLTPFGFENTWRRALHDGVIAGGAFASEAVTAVAGAMAGPLAAALKPAGEGLEITFNLDSHAWDGRFATNGWLQEMPDPMSKATWGNGAHLSPATAKKLGVVEGDVVAVSLGGTTAELPTILTPGQADDSVAITVGQGRVFANTVSDAQRVGHAIGVDTYPVRASTAWWMGAGTVKKTGKTEAVARTQEHHSMAPMEGWEERPLAREQTLVELKKDPTWAKTLVPVTEDSGKRFNLFGEEPDHQYPNHKWGMTIDLNACVGCNACMVACQAENNIPIVGKQGVIKGREMHWIRIDRYYRGDDQNDPTAIMQPVGCHHCENAPCEMVCPVAATTHSSEGLNTMTYNRCVGTRYCANNCPFKVRRFNFFNYSLDVPETKKMQFNPDVTVRSRGVMEKCTYCVQRIQQAKLSLKRENREPQRVRDGEVVVACQQSCPTRAISFGDLNDASSEVARRVEEGRSYKLLEEINIRPRTSYLARVRNPNPELEVA